MVPLSDGRKDMCEKLCKRKGQMIRPRRLSEALKPDLWAGGQGHGHDYIKRWPSTSLPHLGNEKKAKEEISGYGPFDPIALLSAFPTPYQSLTIFRKTQDL